MAALLVIAVGPPWLCIAQGASWWLVVAGAVVWFASVCLKRIVVQSGRALFARAAPSRVRVAVVQGVVSAVTELGAAGLYLAVVTSGGATPTGPAVASAVASIDLSLIDIVGFGVGAGSAEAFYVLLLGVLGPQADDEELQAWLRGARLSLCVRYAVPVERLFALIGHTGARGLLYVALLHGPLAGAVWALSSAAFFVLIDGVAVYGHLQKWRWHDPVVCRRAHSFFALLSVAECALFVLGFELSA